MKAVDYRLAGDIPELLRSTKEVTRSIKTKEAESLEEMHNLVEDGKVENVLKLAQAQYDIIVQRKVRDAAGSDVIADILAGKDGVEVDGEKLDFSGMTEDERREYAIAKLQEVADAYVYGARPLIAGGGTKAAKAALEDKKKIAAAAAADPELATKLAALGITV